MNKKLADLLKAAEAVNALQKLHRKYLKEVPQIPLHEIINLDTAIDDAMPKKKAKKK